ncbi:mediator complex, subunit Med5 [Geopyxis carbonaria]|nr:mediator complex, subunit Med5 [Geopyxis carbonaria]
MTAPAPTDVYLRLFKKCLNERVPADRFESLYTQLHARTPLPTTLIAATLLSPELVANTADPLHLSYVSQLLFRDTLSLSCLLTALHKTAGRAALEQDLFLALAAVVRTSRPRSAENVWTAVSALSEWMETVMASAFEAGRLEALGELVIALGSNEDAVRVLGEGVGRRERRVAFQTGLTGFAQYVAVQNPPLAQRLEELRQMQAASQSPRMARAGQGGKKDAIDGMMMGLGGDAAVAAGPVAWTRAHLFIWLNALLAGKPQVDEEYMVGYLFSRYKDENNELLTDFVVAVIDVMACAILRGEAPNVLFPLRSFVVNKVPLLLRRLCPGPMAASFAISQAFARSDVTSLMNIAPPLLDPYAIGSNSSSDMFSEMSINIQQEFLFACALHGVISESDIQGILGELPLGALPANGRYNSQVLLTDCMMDPIRLDRLVEEEIEAMDGNSGAVCRAIFELIRQMCVSRETMPLHRVCAVLTRKPASIDVMALFVKPAELLQPLCTLLDTWRYEEDQGEYQPVYEEFGAILLLVLTIVHRFNIPPSSLPVPPTSFIPTLLTTSARPLDELDETTSTQLGGWLKELFEGEGISDDLLSSCPPQSFHKLVPTLFSQSLAAVAAGVLDLDTVREAFTFLLEPFLLPAVIAGLLHLSHHLWATLDSPASALALLTALLVPPASMQPENKQAHTTVTALIAPHLLPPLRVLLRRGSAAPPNSAAALTAVQAAPIVARLPPARPSFDELTAWTTAPLSTALTNAYTSLLTWSNPTGYTPRLLVAAWRILGAVRVLTILVTAAAAAKAEGTHAPGAPEDVVVAMAQSALPDGGEGQMAWGAALRVLHETVGAGGTEGGVGEVVVGVMRRGEVLERGYTPKGVVGMGEEEEGGMEIGMGMGMGNGGAAVGGMANMGGMGGMGGMGMEMGGSMGGMGMGGMEMGMGMEGMEMMMGGGLMFDGMELS